MNTTNTFDITLDGSPIIVITTDGTFSRILDNIPDVDQFSPESPASIIRRRVMMSFID